MRVLPFNTPGVGPDISHVHTDDAALVVYFSPYQNDWPTNQGPQRFGFLNFARRGGAGALLLRDRRNFWFTQGIDGAPTVEAIVRLIEDEARNYDLLITMGSSMGGYAALLYGQMANADLSVALVPQIRIGRAATAPLGEFRFDADQIILDAISPGNPLYRLDDHLPGDGKTHFASVIGERLEIDVRHQELLARHPRIDDVRLPDSDHNDLPTRFIEHALLRPIVERSPISGRLPSIEAWVDQFSLKRPT